VGPLSVSSFSATKAQAKFDYYGEEKAFD
jgi:hypothetical protein